MSDEWHPVVPWCTPIGSVHTLCASSHCQFIYPRSSFLSLCSSLNTRCTIDTPSCLRFCLKVHKAGPSWSRQLKTNHWVFLRRWDALWTKQFTMGRVLFYSFGKGSRFIQAWIWLPCFHRQRHNERENSYLSLSYRSDNRFPPVLQGNRCCCFALLS